MATPYPEWRLLNELAKQPVMPAELPQRLSQGPPMSSLVLSTCLGRLQAWGWMREQPHTGLRRLVNVYTITDAGLEALILARQRGGEAVPLEVARELQQMGASCPEASPEESPPQGEAAHASGSALDRPPLTFTAQSLRVLEELEDTYANFFITGRAGTGKSTLLQHFRATTEKQVVVLAPTGVAAVNVGGQTIHSFFRFPPGITLDKVRSRSSNRALYEHLDTVIIDEISMVRADLFDCIEKCLRLDGPVVGAPFGGVQLVLFGDLYQLPPVVPSDEARLFQTFYKSPYFFDAQLYPQAQVSTVELTEVYRQRDPAFVALLDAVRTGTLSEADREALNAACTGLREPPPARPPIHLMTTNAMADQVNRAHQERLSGKAQVYVGSVRGSFGERQLPTHEKLRLRVGARVMLLNNDEDGRWINGDLGWVVALAEPEQADGVLTVDLDRGGRVKVSPYTWEVIRFVYDRNRGRIESEVMGSFTQYPLRLAWAVTIHKAQGKTFDEVVVDVGRGTFAPGQAYVALSRCTTLAGLQLRRPLLARHVWADERIRAFLTDEGCEGAEAVVSTRQESPDGPKAGGQAAGGLAARRVQRRRLSDDLHLKAEVMRQIKAMEAALKAES